MVSDVRPSIQFFEDRFYLWCRSQWDDELRADFATLRSIHHSHANAIAEVLEGSSAQRARAIADALVSSFHTAAARRAGAEYGSEQIALLDDFDAEVERRKLKLYRRRPPPSAAVGRRVAAMLRERLPKAVGGVPVHRTDLLGSVNAVRGFKVHTVYSVQRPSTVRYYHSIFVSQYEHLVSLVSWPLGMGVPNCHCWEDIQDDDVEGVVSSILELARRFVSVAETLLPLNVTGV